MSGCLPILFKCLFLWRCITQFRERKKLNCTRFMDAARSSRSVFHYADISKLNDIYFDAVISDCYNSGSGYTNENDVIYYACYDFHGSEFCPFGFVAILGRWWMFFNYSVAYHACTMEKIRYRSCQITCSLAEQVSFRQGVKNESYYC